MSNFPPQNPDDPQRPQGQPQGQSQGSWNEPTAQRPTPYGAPSGGHTGGGPGGPSGPSAPGQGGPGGPYGTRPQGYAAPPPQQPLAPSEKSFFAKLFDLSFRSYITPSIVKIVYILTMIAIVFGWLAFSIATFSQSTGAGLFVLLIAGPIYAFFMLVLMRITLEFYVAVIRIAEDMADLRARR